MGTSPLPSSQASQVQLVHTEQNPPSRPHQDVLSTPLLVLGLLISRSFLSLLSKEGSSLPYCLGHCGTTPATGVSTGPLASTLVYNRKPLKHLSEWFGLRFLPQVLFLCFAQARGRSFIS